MKLSIETLRATLKSTLTDIMRAQGLSLSAAMRETIDERVNDLLKPNSAKNFWSREGNDGEDPTGGFKSLSDFAFAVHKAEKKLKFGTGEIDSRLTKAAGSSSMEELTPEAGGYLIPAEFRAELLSTAVDNSDLLRLCFAIPMGSTTVNIPYVQGFDRSSGLTHGGIQFNWTEELGEISGIRPKLGQIGLRLRKLTGMIYTSNELLEDSPQSAEALIKGMFSDSLAWTLEGAILNGTGAGQPLGIYNSPCLISIDKEDGQAADTILYENIAKAYARMWRKKNAIWLANDDTLPQLLTMSLAVGTGGVPLFQPAGGASAAPYNTLIGKPLFFSEHCRKLGDKGDLYFCDWSQYLLGQKAGGAGGNVKFDSSLHLKFDFDQAAFRLTTRLDGQPWWSSSLTPRYSSATMSPFITLAERAAQ